MTSMTLRSRAIPARSRHPLAALFQPYLLATLVAIAGCGGGSSSTDVDPLSAESVAPLAAPPGDDVSEEAATRSALEAFLAETKPSLLSLSDRPGALLGGGGGARPIGGGGGSGDTPVAPVTPVTPAAPVAPVAIPGAPIVNAARLMAAVVGFDAVRVAPTREPVLASDGNFRTSCAPSHMAYDDPIVFPGQPGRSHLHTFFGNTAAGANSTAESIRGSGNSTCLGGLANRSAYWVPTMIDTRDGTPITPVGMGVYYKHGYVDASLVQPIPAGLRMIAGNASATGPTTTEFAYRFKCIGGPRNQNDLYLPTIGNCDAGAELWQEIFFPACWDGRNLDSPDHKSHVNYNMWTAQRGYFCPPSHPVSLPQITFNVVYAVPEVNAALRWRLASDTYSTSLPAGYSSHGDWFNGWIPEVSEAWTRACVQAKKDCRSHLLGDGRMLF